MSYHKYDNPDDAYKEAQLYIKRAKDQSVAELYLNGLGLTAVPPEVGLLTELERLYLNDNLLTAIPPEIGQLVALTNLNLRDNQLTNLPSEIGILTELTSLRLLNNQLKALPPEIMNLTKLKLLDLQGNPDLAIPSVILEQRLRPRNILGYVKAQERINKVKENSATVLNLSGLGLAIVPQEISQLTELVELDLSQNELTSVPLEIASLTNR